MMTPRTSEPLRIATRGSALALRQTDIVRALLARAHPGLETDVVIVTTTGDRDPRPFSEIGGKGLFTSEVERAVVEGRADAAVHSAKDLTAELADGCALVCVPGRADAEDVVVGGQGSRGEERLASLRPGAKVGTSSMRRRALLAELRPDLDPVALRGNLDTRLRKVAEGTVDVAIVARAGLQRLGSKVDAAGLDPARWVPAPGQGALAVEGLAERTDIAALFAPLDDVLAHARLTCERAFARTMEGGCSIPLGCSASLEGDALVVTGFLGMPDGSAQIRDRISGPPARAEEMGRELAAAMLNSGGDAILAEIRSEELLQVEEP